MQVIVSLKKMARFLVDIVLLSWGLVYYHFNRSKPLNERTPPKAYLAMIRLFCVTGGHSNDFLSWCISLFDKPLTLPDSNGVLGDLSSNALQSITRSLDENGFYIFENKLPTDQIEALTEFALSETCRLRKLDHEDCSLPLRREQYNRMQISASFYEIPEEKSASNHLIQNLLVDHSILAVAQGYLKTSAKADPVAFWWSTPFSQKAQSNAAQLFHFDMDRLKWLKFFIFLTDVTLETGPHVFIRGSHKTGAIPKHLLRAGYSRHEDPEVLAYFNQADIKTFVVPAGTIFAEDTRGLHKGTPLIHGERLVLELQFSNSSFGSISNSLKTAKIEEGSFLEFARKNKRIYNLYPVMEKQ